MNGTGEPLSPATREEGRVWRWVSPAVSVLLFAAAVWVLHRELREVRYADISAALRALPPSRALLALLFTAANYALLTGFDLLAFAYVGKRVAAWKVAFASFTGYAISNSVGFPLLSGTSVRYRFYSRWGLTAGEISRVVVFYFGTFWLGLLLLGGWSLAFDPHPGLQRLSGGAPIRVLGIVLLLLAAGYAVAALLRRAPLRVWRWEVPFPPPRLVGWQFLLSTLDWVLAASIFFVLLPPGRLTFQEFLGAFLAAQVLGLLSHVPGGLGVFDGAMLLLLRPYLPAETVLSSLVLFRIAYYLLPLVAALALLVADEVRQRRRHLARWGGFFGALTRQLVPKVLAVFVFLAGALLLFSGATPDAAGRVSRLHQVVPPAVTEASHFLGSVVGVGLLVVSHGVARRLDVAFYLAAVGLAVGIAASLLKGGAYEEAVLLVLVLAALVPARAEFDRRAAFGEARFSPVWLTAVLAVMGASIWLGLFAFRHVEYSGDLWWRFAADQGAPRFLRASVGATTALLAFGLFLLLRSAPPAVRRPTDEEMEAVDRIVARQSSTVPYLVYLRDKMVLLGESRDAFLMYAVQGRSWVAMGGVVGPPERAPELVRAFLARCDDYGGDPVFYHVPADRLHLYADFGLTFARLGEEAFVPLRELSLEGAAGKPFRVVLNRFAKSGAVFRVVPPEEVPALLPELREVSDAWLAHRGAAEKGFSLAFFTPEVLARFPAAVVEEGGRITAFASVWPGPGGVELSVGLVRYREEAQKNVMEALLLHLMLWGKERGFARFNLGMAPLSGLEVSAMAPAREPRYLAYPGGLALPRILADVSALIAGGYRKVLRRKGER